MVIVVQSGSEMIKLDFNIVFLGGGGGREGGSICGYQYFQEHYHNTRHTMEVKSVGTFPVILLKLVTPPLPPQTKLNLEQNG